MRRGMIFATGALAAMLATSACDKLPGGNSVLGQLKRGDPKVCAAPQVQEVLRGMIRPQARSFAFTSMSEPDAKRIIDGFRIEFENGTLEAKDEAVSRVTCQAQAIVIGANDTRSSGMAIRYDIKPSAEASDKFVVNGDVSGATAYLSGAALATITAELLTGERQGGATPAPDGNATPKDGDTGTSGVGTTN